MILIEKDRIFFTNISGQDHRDNNLPAFFKQFPSGSYIIEYYFNGYLHRTDGPARITLTQNKIEKTYAYEGVKMKAKKWKEIKKCL